MRESQPKNSQRIPESLSEWFHRFFGASCEAVLLEDRRQRIVEANAQAARIFAFPHRELLRKRLADLLEADEPTLPIYGDPEHEINVPMESSAIRGDGEEIQVEFTISTVEAGGATYFLSVFRDITQRRRAEQTLRASETGLKKAFMAKQRQMDQISTLHARFLEHDFRPMAGLDFAAHCRPCADVGGDFYLVRALSDGRVAVCMGDVSGHGAAAAVATATTRALLGVALEEAEPGHGPGRVLWQLSTWLQKELEPEQFVTMWLGLWEPVSSTLVYASGAHPPAVICRGGSNPEYLSHEQTFPIGLSDIDPEIAEETERKLDPGDRVIIYTDGWTESPSWDGGYLEGDRLLDFLGNADMAPLRQVPVLLLMEFERHAANSRITDDVTLLAFECMK